MGARNILEICWNYYDVFSIYQERIRNVLHFGTSHWNIIGIITVYFLHIVNVLDFLSLLPFSNVLEICVDKFSNRFLMYLNYVYISPWYI